MKTKTSSPSPHSGTLQSDCWAQIASLILKGKNLSTEMMKMSLLPSQKKLMNSIKLFGYSPLKKSARIYIWKKSAYLEICNRNIKYCKSFCWVSALNTVFVCTRLLGGKWTVWPYRILMRDWSLYCIRWCIKIWQRHGASVFYFCYASSCFCY